MSVFPQLAQAVTDAANAITGFKGQLPEEKWDEYADAGDELIVRLRQLNMSLNIAYAFEEGLPGDIINYAALMNEHQQPCGELLQYLLDRGNMFGDTYKYETMFLEEVVNGIIHNSNVISNTLNSSARK